MTTVKVGVVAVFTVLLAALSGPAQAQGSRGFVSISGGLQTAPEGVTDSRTFDVNAETASTSVTYDIDSGPFVDVSAGVRVWRVLGIGVGVTRFSQDSVVSVAGSIPHPFFFGQPRAINGVVEGVKREEVAVHLQVRAIVEPTSRVQVNVFGGPSFFRVKEGVVQEIRYAEAYPYDEATFTTVQLANDSESAVGFHVGGDVSFFFSNNVGVGISAQFSDATIEYIGLGGDTLEVSAGGRQVGAGIRLRF